MMDIYFILLLDRQHHNRHRYGCSHCYIHILYLRSLQAMAKERKEHKKIESK